MKNFDERTMKPKIEKESEIIITQASSNTCENNIKLEDPVINIEPDSNNCKDDYDADDSKSNSKVLEESCKGLQSIGCERKVRGRMPGMRQVSDGLLGSSKPKRSRIAKKSYCEDSSSADSEDEYLQPKRKRTKVFAIKNKTSKERQSKNGGKGKSSSSPTNAQLVQCEKPSSKIPLMKQEHLSETDDPIKCSDEKKPEVRGIKNNKTKGVRKYSRTKVEVKEKMTFEELCEFFQTNHQTNHENFYKQYRKLVPAFEGACKKFVVYRCKICTGDFENMDRAEDHFKKQHSAYLGTSSEENLDTMADNFIKYYKCDQCGLAIRFMYELVKHVDSFHSSSDKQEMYSCDKCTYNTIHKYKFSSHMKSHDCPKKKTECHLCHLSFVDIKSHMKNMHSSKPNKIKCQLCHLALSSLSNLNKHKNTVHAKQKGTNFVCKECGKVCKNVFYLKKHVLRCHFETEQIFECHLCQTKFKSREGFKRHTDRHNGRVVKSGSYFCADCEKRFPNKNLLLAHIKRKHDPTFEGPKKNHLCETCGKAFIEKQTLDRHMVVHTKEKKFVCTTCNKGFTQINSLKSHQVVHTGIKPFECGKCGNKYSQKYPLTQHIRKHHPD